MILCLMKRASLIIALALSIAALSCRAAAPVKVPLAPVYNGPVSAEALSGRIAFSGIPGLRAEIKAALWRGQKRIGVFKGALVIRPPDDMRVVLYDTFGNTVMDIVRADGSLEVLVPSKDALYLGHAPSMMPPAGSEMNLEMIEDKSGQRTYELSSTKEGRVLSRYEFDSRSALNTSASVKADNGWIMEARFMDHLFEREGNIPGSVVLTYGPDFRLEFAIADPETTEVSESLIPLGRSASRIYDISELEAAE
jgi:hypothetical protein